MPGKLKKGQSIFIPFKDGFSIYDSQNKARMYMSEAKFRASFPGWRFGQVELVEYAPVRHSYWIDNIAVKVDDSVLHDYECAECTIHSGVDTAFCPNCGAVMDVRMEEDNG